MSTELPKTYDPAAVEATAYQTWLDEKCFAADPNAPGEGYSIVIPPPNVTGALHLGHAINNTLQDILTRKARMEGKNTVWIPGIDHAGIATQAVVEKQLKEKEGKTRHDVGREGLVERIWQWKQQYGDRILSQLRRLGASCDWDRTRFTLDEQCAKAVRHTFFKLFKDGLIYRGKRLVNWDIFLQTSISDDEIYHETVKTSLWHIKYPIVDASPRGMGFQPMQADQGIEQHASSSSSGTSHGEHAHATFMVVATTRPETMLGDTAVAVHSEDPRWNWAIGKFVRLPLVDRLIPIIADDILVDPKFGSGVVKVTPAHDPNDYAVWQRHQGKADQIDLINILHPDGRINDNGGKYAGCTRNEARKRVVADLEHQGLLAKEEPYETQVGHSDRSKTPIEPYLSDQWFVKMAPLAEPALEVVRNGTIKFYPERHAQQYLAWLGEKRDWPISRQLWWGHRIPVWELTPKVGTAPDPEEWILATERAFRAWCAEMQIADDVFVCRSERQTLFACARSVKSETILDRLTQMYLDQVAYSQKEGDEPKEIGPATDYGLPDEATWELEQTLDAIVHDPDVLDTWFSSALWPHSTLGWPEQTPDLAKWYPTSVLLTGRDIITLWVARMVMTGMYNMGEGTQARRHEGTKARSELPDADAPNDAGSSPSCLRASVPPCLPSPSARALGIPFSDVAINPTILDGKGERMSKSKGNGVDPVDIIETHGADALRFTMTQMATETQDARLPVKKLPDGRNTSDKFDVGRNFCNKLWNAARYVLASIEGTETESRRHEGTKAQNQMQCSQVPSDSSSAPSCLRAFVPSCLPDQWILSRFNRTVDEANAALKQYRFDQYAKLCYDFFWRDFCDWYVEVTKPAMKDPARAAQTAEVLAAVLDGSLRLMHPMIPFITETIWWRLNEVRPQRGLPGILDCPPSRRLIRAQWPTPPLGGFAADTAEQVFPKLQEIIGTIRNVRNEYKVDPRKPVSVSIGAAAEWVEQILANREVVETLGVCKLNRVAPNLPAPADAAAAAAAGCDIYVEGLIDHQAEEQRVAKRREELTKQVAALKGRLANASYIAKAPPHLVKQTQDQLAEAEAELAKLG